MIKTIIAILFSSSIAFAVGDAGCGLGGMLIKTNSKLMQLFAVTTNGTSGSQTLGITSGTSDCTSKGLVKNDSQIQYFVEVNHTDIIREMAQGYGDKLSTLAALNGCMTDAQISAFNTKVQSSFRSIVPTSNTPAIDLVKNMQSAAIADVCSGS